MTSSVAGGAPDAPNDAPAPLAVVACHGELADGLVSAVAQITGQGGRLVPLSNRGLSPAELEARLRAAVDAGPVRAVFTDLPGGSWTMAARRVQRDHPGLALAAGVNLAALLEFVCATAAPDADAAATVARALDRGRASLVAIPVPASAAGGGR